MKFSDLQAKLAALKLQSQQHPKPTLRTIKSEAAVPHKLLIIQSA